MKIIGLGNALVDMLIQIPNDEFLQKFDLPKGSMQLSSLEQTTTILEAAKNLKTGYNSGGSAANTIHGLASLGASAGYIGTVGNDEHGTFFSKDMHKNNIVPLLENGSQPTGRAMALISPDGERTFATYLGSAIELSAQHVTAEKLKGYDLLHLEGYLAINHNLIEGALKTAKEAGMETSIDLASYNVVEENREFLLNLIEKYIDIVFANEEEAKSLTNQEPEVAIDIIAGLCNIAVVKLGSKGSLIKRNNKKVTTGVIPCSPIDTTGAGDLYAAGFLYGLSRKQHLEVCGKIAAILAGNVIEHIGAKIPKNVWPKIRDEVKNLIV